MTTIVKRLTTFIDHTKALLDEGRLERRPFYSNFHEKLDQILADPEKARNIVNCYQKHLLPFLSESERQVIEEWLLDKARFIGFIPIKVILNERLIKEETRVLLYKYQEHLSNFFEEIRTYEKPCFPKRFPVTRDADPQNIVIITTTGGGGHKSTAESLEQILAQFPKKYNVTVIDIAEIAKQSDSIFHYSGILTVEEVYDKIFQQEHRPDVANALWELHARLNAYHANTSMADLKERIRTLNPDLIISTCHHLERDLEVSSALNVPIRFMHCDYEFSYPLVPLLLKVNPAVVKFWVPERDSEILRSIPRGLRNLFPRYV